MEKYISNALHYWLCEPKVSTILKLEGWETKYNNETNNWQFYNINTHSYSNINPKYTSNAITIIEFYNNNQLSRYETKVLLNELKLNNDWDDAVARINAEAANRGRGPRTDTAPPYIPDDILNNSNNTTRQARSSNNTALIEKYLNIFRREEQQEEEERAKLVKNVAIGVATIAAVAAAAATASKVSQVAAPAAAAIASSFSSSSSSSSKKDKVVSYITRYKQISGENALFYSGNLEYDNDNIYTREDIDVYEGPRGGKYYYNSYGNKIYI